MNELPPERTAFVHVGTHKTGTTSIQAMLAGNQEAFRSGCLFVPRTGRLDAAYAGHHNIAWDLAGSVQFDPARGSFAQLIAEIDASDAPAICLSSEEFEFLHMDAPAMERLRDGLRSLGYEPHIIIHLRPQADYIESLYAEIARVWNVGFDDFLESIIARGAYCCSRFDYDELTGAFARTFGHDRITVRAYKAAEPPATLLYEFAALVAPQIPHATLQLPPRLNRKSNFADVIAARESVLDCVVPYHGDPKQSFDPLSILDLARIVVRFSGANERIARTYGTRIPTMSPALFARELLTEILRDRESRFRKRLIRMLVDESIEFAA